MAPTELRNIRAAVLRQPDCHFEIEELQIEEPRADEVRIKMVAVGMCHTDIVVGQGLIPLPQPCVLGHEGSGIVEAVGSAVTKVRPGDHVVLTFVSCGSCENCLSGHPARCELSGPLNFASSRADGSHALYQRGAPIHDRFFGQSSFATMAIASERNVVKVTKDAPLELLGPLGCGLQTGAGAVLNALQVGFGDTLVIFGAGAVGLSAVMAARLAGAGKIVVVDIVPSRLELAGELGAHHVVDGNRQDVEATIRQVLPNGTHFALDTTGNVTLIRLAVDCLRPGGTCGILGASSPDKEIRLDPVSFMSQSKRLMGIVEGDAVPDLFIPRLIDHYLQGHFPFDRLVKFFPFEAINDAISASERGEAVKPIIRLT